MNKTEIKQYIIRRFQEECPEYTDYDSTIIDLAFVKTVNNVMSILHIFIDLYVNPQHVKITLFYYIGDNEFPRKEYLFYPEGNGFRKEEVNE